MGKKLFYTSLTELSKDCDLMTVSDSLMPNFSTCFSAIIYRFYLLMAASVCAQ